MESTTNRINRVFIGIPEELKAVIFWVGRDFRMNDLSLQIGGTDIIVEYTNGKTLGYDWVKYPAKYIKRIFHKELLDTPYENELIIIKEKVKRIFARKFNPNQAATEAFTEIWNNTTSLTLPYPLLEKFTFGTYDKFLRLFLDNLEFSSLYLSVNYPFKHQHILENWGYLEKGTAHYCVFHSDTDMIYTSKLGLCYNNRIRWNSKLKAMYDYGFENLFDGCIDGTGTGPVDFDERDYLDDIIPMDSRKEFEFRNSANISYWGSVYAPTADFDDPNFEGPNLYDIEQLFEPIPYLEFVDFEKMFRNNKWKIIVNECIWENTLKYIIDDNFCDIIIEQVKKVKK